jgi:multiple sugar transport system ATP-binding protein
MASLEILNVRKQYGHLEVLRNVNVQAEHGEFLVLLGPSGCGKSTLLNMIAGLDHTTAGEIRIDGEVVNELEPKDRDIAMVFQSYALYPSMNVADNISFGMRVRGIPKPQRDAEVKRVAAMLRLDSLLDRRPSQLSGGQRQRVAMGRALVRNPKVFLFDEPLSNLDAKLRVEMRTEIKKLHHTLGATIVYVTHDQIEAMTLATKIVVMRQAVVQQIGSPQEVYDKPVNMFVASFIGSPPMNLIPATLRKAGTRILIEMCRSHGDAITLDLGSFGPQHAPYIDSEIILGARPETITEVHHRKEEESAEFDAVIEVLEPTGSDNLAVLSLGRSEVIARLRPGSGAVGAQMKFAINVGKTVLFDPKTEARIA